MQTTKIQITTGYLDVENFDIPLNLQVSDIRDISKRSGNWSKTVKLAGTKNNNIQLNNYFDVNIVAGTFDVNKKTLCNIIQNGTVIFENCYLQLLKTTKVPNNLVDDLVSYEVQILSTMGDMFKNISTLELNDLKFTELNHIYETANVVNSYDNTVVDGYKYVLPHTNENTYRIHELLPAIYAKQYFDKIHSNAGYSYTWSTLDAANVRFDKLLIPYVGDKKKLGEDFLKSIEVIAENTSLQTQSITPAAGIITTSPTLKLDVTTEIKDLTNTYDPVTSIYTNQYDIFQPNSLDYQIEIDWEMEFVNTDPFLMSVYLTKNGTNPDNVLKIRPRLSVWNQFGTNKGQVNANFININSLFSSTAEIIDGDIVFNSTTEIPFGTTSVGTSTETITINATQLNPGYLLELRRQISVLNNIGGGWNVRNSINTIDRVLTTRLKINSIKVKIVPNSDNTILPSTNIDMQKLIPQKVKQTDFLNAIYQMYNLYATIDPINPNNIVYQHRDNFYDSGSILDWTNKLAKNQESNIQFLPDVTAKRMILSYKNDSNDYILNSYNKETGKTYGQYEVIFENENVKGVETKEILFSPTINLPTDFGSNNPYFNFDFKNNLRILLDNGEQSCGDYNIDNGDGTESTFNTYPFLSMIDSVQNPTFDINYAQPDYYAYDLGIPTHDNLSTNFWRRTFAQINGGQLYTAYFNLNEVDIANLKLNDKIKVGNALWYINRVIDYNGNKRQLTKVELLSVEDDLKLPKVGNLVEVGTEPVVPAPAPVVPSGPGRPVIEGIIRNDQIRNSNSSLILTNRNFTIYGNDNIIQPGATGILIGNGIDTDIVGIQVGSNTIITENSISANEIIVSNEYALPQVDGNPGDIIYTDGTGNTYWDSPLTNNVIDITRADLLAEITANTLIPNTNYFITDRNIWVTALGTNLINPNGYRKQSIVKNTWYTPQTVAGFFTTNYLGVYGQTIAQGSVPNENLVAGGNAYYVIWGGRMWRRDIAGADVPGTSQGEINAGWTVVAFSDTTIYDEKIFKVVYDVVADLIKKQSDDRNNNIINTTEIVGFQSADLTDWGNLLILENESSGIFNNWQTTLPASISRNKCVALINNNRNSGIIVNNRCQEIRNNGIAVGGISNNIVSNVINDNNCNGLISQNIVGGSIVNNVNNGRIIVNNCNSSISGNLANVTNIDYNNIVSTGGLSSIFDNNNTGNIRQNKTESIDNNTNGNSIIQNIGGRISSNSNIGTITKNILIVNISLNSNNGNIEGNVIESMNNNTVNGNINNNIARVINGNDCLTIANNDVGKNSISSNTCLLILDNFVNGVINGNSGPINFESNTVNGNISVNIAGVGATVNVRNNNNNGNIFNCTFLNTLNVEFNHNNGNIGPGIYTANIIDPIVNK